MKASAPRMLGRPRLDGSSSSRIFCVDQPVFELRDDRRVDDGQRAGHDQEEDEAGLDAQAEEGRLPHGVSRKR